MRIQDRSARPAAASRGATAASRHPIPRALRTVGLGLGLVVAGFLAAASAQSPRPSDDRGDASDAATDPGGAKFVIARRSVAQDQGAWVVDYRLRYQGATGIVLTPADLTARVEGWVSNSRVAGHALPRRSRVVVEGASGLSGSAELIASDDESNRCTERVAISLCTGAATPLEGGGAVSVASIGPGAELCLRLRFEHQHVLYGTYNPLLGTRAVELKLGPTQLCDRISLEVEHYLAQAKGAWPEPPDDRRDTRQFVSAPDSLHLESMTPGHMYYRYPERPVRYGTKLRLSFWYLIAEGTEGECRVRLAQYKDTPSSWRVLTGGASDRPLEAVGRWTKYECITQAEAEATTVALDFRINSETNVGEMWIDDVSLEPVNCAIASQGP